MALRVGSNIDSWCTRCKMMLAHTIEAVVDGEAKRVECNTCRSKHIHRANPPGTSQEKRSVSTPRAKSLGASTKKGGAGLAKASDYQNLMKNRLLQPTLKYSIRETFAEGDVVSHVNFGIGVVTADKGAGKIEVLFPEGAKVLVHSKTA